MKKFILILFFANQLFSQEKSEIIYSNETVIITQNKLLEIKSFIEESRLIKNSKYVDDYTIQLHYNNFNYISNISATTVNSKSKNIPLDYKKIIIRDAKVNGIFKCDAKIKEFKMPAVDDNSIINFSYTNTEKEPRLLSSFYFQNYLKTKSSRFQIKCPPTVEIGFILMGSYQDKIVFSKTAEKKLDVYTWEAKDLPEFETESQMPNYRNYIPHIIYYIKSYKFKDKEKTLLGTTELLYKWYYSLIENINITDETDLKDKTLILIKDKTTDYDKAQVLYQWVQQNIHYVAFEDGMGGFIPRDAGEVYSKLYGDCKDMANLLNRMLEYAGIKSHLTWVGTREIPYKYSEVPTPNVDNHMVVTVVLDGKNYFLDSTDKYCPFTFPSAMIQGKEALIGISEKEYKIELIPIADADKNSVNLQFNFNLDKNNNIIGDGTAYFSGYEKSDLLHLLAENNQSETAVWKSILNSDNKKIIAETDEIEKKEYEKSPSKVTFIIKYTGGTKEVDDNIIFKPLIITPFKETTIDIQEREFPIQISNNYVYNIDYEYTVPNHYKIISLPETISISNNNISFDVTYSSKMNTILIKQKLEWKKLLLENKDFEEWNASIKTINKHYNQYITISK